MLSIISDVLGPIAELLCYVLLLIFALFGAFPYDLFLLAICIMMLSTMINTIIAVIIQSKLTNVSFQKNYYPCLLEFMGYRQALGVFRIIGWWRFIRHKHEWGDMGRQD